MSKGATKTTYQVAPTRLADARLDRHVAAVGLADRAAYRRWCREHGFGDGVHKSWRQHRAERARARRIAAESRDLDRLRDQAGRLGLRTVGDYLAWCAEHDRSDSARKSAETLVREREIAAVEAAAAALERARANRRRPDDIVRAIFNGNLEKSELRTAGEHELFKLVGAIGKKHGVRDAFLSLILALGIDLEALTENPFIADIGWSEQNSLLAALYRVATLNGQWITTPQEWKGEFGGPRRRFGALVRRLFTRYHIPAFMDRTWFEPDGANAGRYIDWYLTLAAGHNLRTARELPIALTSRMVHCAMRAPSDLSIDGAMRWGQVRGLGGSIRTARAILSTRLAAPQEDEPFWATVVQFFVNHAMLDPAQIGPIVDYLHNQKYVPVDGFDEGGEWMRLGPPQPDLTMKGRSASALVRLVQAWHAALAIEKRPKREWPPSGIACGRVTWSAGSSHGARWTVQELLSSKELHQEGRYMHHCVATYADSCANGSCSIWSLRLRSDGTGGAVRVLTIEVRNRSRKIVQVRGRYNNVPPAACAPPILKAAQAPLERWAHSAGLTIDAGAY